MALPTSGPLSMQDIATEFSQGSSNMSLYTFGSTLPTPTATSNIELANDFYGQSAISLTSFSYNSQVKNRPNGACNLESIEDTAYHDGSGSLPAIGDKVYDDSSGDSSSRLDIGSYKYDNGGGSGGFMRIIANGEVSRIGNCR